MDTWASLTCCHSMPLLLPQDSATPGGAEFPLEHWESAFPGLGWGSDVLGPSGEVLPGRGSTPR